MSFPGGWRWLLLLGRGRFNTAVGERKGKMYDMIV